MKKKVLLVVLAIMGLSFGLRAQEYWIEGFYERLGEGKYTLKHIQTNGIELDGKTNLQGTLYGEKTSVQGQDGLTGTMI